jgi:hypothetical protein
MKRAYARNRMRPTTAPEMRAGVMIANIIWKTMNARCGTPSAYASLGSVVTSVSPAKESPPMRGVPGANASE